MLHETEAQERKVGQCWGPRMEALPRSCNRVSEGGSSAPDPGGGVGCGIWNLQKPQRQQGSIPRVSQSRKKVELNFYL